MSQPITTFNFPTPVIFGAGAMAELPGALDELGISKPLIVTDPGIVAAGLVKIAQDILAAAGVSSALFEGVAPNPLIENVEKARDVFRSEGCDGVIGLGGGSAIDAAKVVPVAVANDEPLLEFDVASGGGAKIKGPLVDIIAIPTTAGTGSEVGRCAVLTSLELGRKFLICHPDMLPKRAILDPKLTTGLPAGLTAATGMDAFTHCVEALAVPMYHPMCDGIALKGIELVAGNLENAVRNPADLEARGHMLVAAMMGAVAFQKDLGATHSMAHPLSSECQVHHGVANAICLPHVMRFNVDHVIDKYAEVARILGVDTASCGPKDGAMKGIEAIEALNGRIGIPGNLSAVNVREDHLDALTQKAFLDGCHSGNPRPCSEEDFRTLFEKAL